MVLLAMDYVLELTRSISSLLGPVSTLEYQKQFNFNKRYENNGKEFTSVGKGEM